MKIYLRMKSNSTGTVVMKDGKFVPNTKNLIGSSIHSFRNTLPTQKKAGK